MVTFSTISVIKPSCNYLNFSVICSPSTKSICGAPSLVAFLMAPGVNVPVVVNKPIRLLYLDGGTGRRKGLKIPQCLALYRFDPVSDTRKIRGLRLTEVDLLFCLSNAKRC